MRLLTVIPSILGLFVAIVIAAYVLPVLVAVAP